MSTTIDPNIMEVLTNTKIFNGFSQDQINTVAQLGKIETAAPKETIIDENWPNNLLSIILSGKVRVILPTEMGDRKIRLQEIQLAILSKGDCIGEYSIIDKKPTSARVVAMQETQLMKISNNHIEALIKQDSDIGMQFYKNLLKIVIEHSRINNKNKDIFLLPFG